MIFVQREGTTGTVQFTGDQARVLDSDGNVVVDWTPEGTISGIPQGDGYTLEVRKGTSTTSEALAVGAVVFTLGQSNIQRWFDAPTAIAAAPGTYSMDSDGSIGAVDGGAARYFAANYAAQIGAPVLIVDAAKGGTALLPEADKGNGYWLDTAPGSLYADALSLLASVGGSAEFVLWAQGETDASSNVTTSQYAAGLTTMMERILDDFDPVRVLIQEIGPHYSGTKYDQVRAAQHQVAAAMGGVDIGAVTTDLNTLEDGIHLSGASRVMAADRLLISALNLLGINTTRALQTGQDDPIAADNLVGGDVRDELRGLAGDDILDGGGESDAILGGLGDDTILGGDGVDLLRGDGGNDSVDGGGGDDVISGGDSQDELEGGDGDDEIWADGGDDEVTGGAGDDVLFGDAGTDTAVYAGQRSNYSIVVSGSTITVIDLVTTNGNEGTDTLEDFEFLEFGDGIYNPFGTGLPPLFTNSTDFVDFGLIGAGTYDPASYYFALAGNDEVYLPQNSTVAGIAGYNSSATFDAGPGNDIVVGGGLKDRIKGGDGNDILNGGVGADTLYGGKGDDTFYVDNTSDSVIELAGEGTDIVRSTVKHTLKSNVENLVLTGTANISGSGNAEDNEITGNSGSNTLSGAAGSDSLIGGAGNDKLDGGTGIDWMEGGTGDDRYTVDNGADVVLENTGSGNDTITSSVSFVLGANLERLTLSGTGSIDGTGNGLANRIDGNAGNNVLVGGDGNDSLYGLAGDDQINGGNDPDTIEGGLGADDLAGGGANDKFVFRSDAEIGGGDTGLPSDVIADFARGDRIDLGSLDANTATSTNDKFAFIGTAGFTAAGQLRHIQDAANGVTYVEGNTNADGVADFRLILTGLHALVASDFTL